MPESEATDFEGDDCHGVGALSAVAWRLSDAGPLSDKSPVSTGASACAAAKAFVTAEVWLACVWAMTCCAMAIPGGRGDARDCKRAAAARSRPGGTSGMDVSRMDVSGVELGARLDRGDPTEADSGDGPAVCVANAAGVTGEAMGAITGTDACGVETIAGCAGGLGVAGGVFSGAGAGDSLPTTGKAPSETGSDG